MSDLLDRLSQMADQIIPDYVDILPVLVNRGWTCINPFAADPDYVGVLSPYKLGDVSRAALKANVAYMGDHPCVIFHRNDIPQLYVPGETGINQLGITYFLTPNKEEEPEDIWDRRFRWSFLTTATVTHLGNTYSIDGKMLDASRDAVWDGLIAEAYRVAYDQGYFGERAKRYARQLLRAQRAYGFTRPLSALVHDIRLIPWEV